MLILSTSTGLANFQFYNCPPPYLSPTGIQLCYSAYSSTFKDIFVEPDEEGVCVTMFERKRLIVTLFKFHTLPNARAMFSGISLAQHQPKTCFLFQEEPPGCSLSCCT